MLYNQDLSEEEYWRNRCLTADRQNVMLQLTNQDLIDTIAKLLEFISDVYHGPCAGCDLEKCYKLWEQEALELLQLFEDYRRE